MKQGGMTERFNHYEWIIKVLEELSEGTKLSEKEKIWLRENVDKMHIRICVEDCIIEKEEKLVVDINEKEILYVQNMIIYKDVRKIDKTKNAFVLLPLNIEKSSYVIFWYISKKE